jgi:hypothetical protein
MSNPQDLKKLIIASLAEKGEYKAILDHLTGETKSEQEEKKTERLNKLIEPLSEFAELMTANTKGVLIENMDKKLSKSTRESLDALAKQINGAIDVLQQEVDNTLRAKGEELTQDHVERLAEARKELETTLSQLVVDVVQAKATEVFASLSEQAKLTEDEIQSIIDEAAFSVETQIAAIIGDYIAEAGITTAQIKDFDTAVKKLLPKERQVTWKEIVGKPDLSQGGTNRNVVAQMIAAALADFSGAASTFLDLTDTPADYTASGGKLLAVKGDASGVEFISPPSGSGDVIGPDESTNNNIALFNGVTGKIIKDSGVTTDSFAPALGADDNYVTDAEKAALHPAMTATDSTEIDFTVTGQDITASLKTGSVASTKLASAVQTSLGKADTASQPGHTHTASEVTDFATAALTAAPAETANSVGTLINGSTATTTPGDTDRFALSISSVLRHVTWANIKATLKTYFDSLYAPTLGADDNYVTDAEKTKLANLSGTNTGDQTLPTRDSLGLDTDDSPQFAGINLGHASDTTIARVSAGVAAIEGNNIVTANIVATDTVKGVVELATTAETTTGTATDLAVTPAGVKAVTDTQYLLTSEASSATPTATGTALKNDYVATALAADATLAAPSGTANANGMIRYRITASGGTRTIGYNAALIAGNITRTTSLAAGKTLTQIYQRVDGEWRCEFDSVTD